VKRKCEYCNNRDVTDAFVCTACMWRACKALQKVPALASELAIVITRQTRYGGNSEIGGGAETPVVFSVDASNAEHQLRNTLSTWCRIYAEETKRDLPDDSLAAMAGYLRGLSEWFRHHRAAAGFIDEVTSTVDEAMVAIDSPPNRTVVDVGPCPDLDTDGGHCPGEVSAYFPTDGSRPHLTCNVCGATWYAESWYRAGRRISRRHAEMMADA